MIKKALSMVLAVGLAVLALPGTDLLTGSSIATETVYAAEDIDAGIYNGVPWRITAEGELLIGEEGKEYSYAYIESRAYEGGPEWPWTRSYLKIQSVKVLGTVHGNGDHFYMFGGLKNTVSIDLTNFDVSEVTKISQMFDYDYALETLELGDFDTGKVQQMGRMFHDCESLISLDLSGFDTSNVITASYMFTNCRKLKSLDLSIFTAQALADGARGMLNGLDSLEQLTLGENLNIRNAGLDKNSWIGPNGTRYSAYELMNNYDGSTMAGTYTYSPAPDLNIAAGNDQGLPWVITPDYQLLIGENDKSFSYIKDDVMLPWEVYMENVAGVRLLGDIKVTTSVDEDYTFIGDSRRATHIDISGLDTSELTTLGRWFMWCESITNLDVSKLNTGKVTSMRMMFASCRSLEELDVSGFDTSNVTDMGYMFNGCVNLKSLDLSGFDMSKVSSKDGMLSGLVGLEELRLGPKADIKGTGFNSGSWQGPDGTVYSAAELMEAYDGASMAGTYLRVSDHVHQWGEWTVRKKATWDTDGLVIRTCSECSETQKEVIPATGVQVIDPVIILSKENFTYDGKNHRPEIIVEDQKGNVLSKIADYVVEMDVDCKSLGEHKATIFFRRGYAGTETQTVSWWIGPPSALMKSIGDGNSVQVKWKRPSGNVDGYEIAFSTDWNLDHASIISVDSAEEIEADFDKPVKADRYYVWLRTYIVVNGEKYYSGWDTMYVNQGVYAHKKKDPRGGGPAASLSRPAKVKATASGDGIKLSWGKINGAIKYRIYCAETKKTYTAKNTSWTDRHAAANKKYTYTITAVAASRSGKSDSDGVKIVAGSAPKSPAGVTAKSGSGEIKLSWKKSSGAVKYEIYRKAAGQKAYQKVGTTTKTTWINAKGIKTGIKYDYYLMPVNAAGSRGSKSKTVSAKIRR